MICGCVWSPPPAASASSPPPGCSAPAPRRSASGCAASLPRAARAWPAAPMVPKSCPPPHSRSPGSSRRAPAQADRLRAKRLKVEFELPVSEGAVARILRHRLGWRRHPGESQTAEARVRVAVLLSTGRRSRGRLAATAGVPGQMSAGAWWCRRCCSRAAGRAWGTRR